MTPDPDPTDTSTPVAPATVPSSATASVVSKRWLTKFLLIGVTLIAFGLWGLYDAMVAYPRRGSQAAEFLEYQYLQALATAGQTTRASIPDPEATLRDLRAKEKAGTLSTLERAENEWLEQLEFIRRLTPANASTILPRTDFRGDAVTDTDARLSVLRKRWTTDAGGSKSAKPLGVFDLPSQWLIFALGTGIGLYILILIVRVKSRTYRWDPATQRLTLPGGESLVPADIEEVDKRKWHRLFVALKIKPTHPQLGGRSIEFDLMRYEAVEAWILEMEQTAFPENVTPAEPSSAPTPPIAAPS